MRTQQGQIRCDETGESKTEHTEHRTRDCPNKTGYKLRDTARHTGTGGETDMGTLNESQGGETSTKHNDVTMATMEEDQIQTGNYF